MKNRFFIIILTMLLGYSSYGQQLQEIPDTNFRNYLISKLPECFTGQLLDTSCTKVKNLKELNVSNLVIADLTGVKFFKALYSLNCSKNNLTTLVNILPDSLVVLDCSRNKFVSLPTLPDSLQVLDCSHNLITSLPTLPIKIDVLKCEDNKLTELPALPNFIFSIIDADSNQLTSLPSLPDSLYYLSVMHNKLSSFPILPATMKDIQHLYLSDNKITSVPELPSTLETFNITDNLISALPALPAGLISLGCSNNTISCLPYLPWKLKYLGFKGNPITCIPNMPSGLISFSGTTTILCSASNTQTNNCDYYIPVSGTVYFDYNGNNTKDADEKGASNILIEASNASAPKTLTNDLGEYTLYLSPGSYLYTAVVSDTLFNKSPGTRFIKIVDGVSNSLPYNFALQPIKEINDLKVSITGASLPRPGFPTTYVITCANTGNNPIDAATLSFAYSSQLSYESSSLNIQSHQDTTLKWALPILYPYQKMNVRVDFTSPASVALGTLFKSKAILKPINSGDTTRNYSLLNQTVVGSFDPNDKSVMPSGAIFPDFIEKQKDLEYTIRFQNTGTAEAINVVVADTLVNELDENTLTMVSASHKYRYDQRGKIVTWTFENINLPDKNSDEPASHGFVKFTIKPKQNLVPGAVIRNRAGIVFDFNEPIITNYTENPLTVESSIISNKVSNGFILYPNPTSSKVYLKLNAIDKSGDAIISIRNGFNQELCKKSVYVTNGMSEIEMDVQHLKAGLYYIELIYNGEMLGEKLLKW